MKRKPLQLDNLTWKDNTSASKLTCNDVQNIKRKLKNGETVASLALEYCVAVSTIRRIKNHESWIHVTIDEDN